MSKPTTVKPRLIPNESPDHYDRLNPQPTEIWAAWNMGPFDANILRYIARYRFKGNPVLDLKKARDYLDLLIAIEEEKAKAEIRH